MHLRSSTTPPVASSSPAPQPCCSPAPAAIARAALAGDGFPVTVEHQLGAITVPETPERVVALIDRDADTLLALGVVPVAIHSRYGFERGVGPWATDELGAAAPTVLLGLEFNYEAIAATRPDLLVYATSGGERDIYRTLSAIAPTVALPKGAVPYGASTEESTLLIAEALGRRSDGERVVAELDAYLAQQAMTYPAFAGPTVNYLDVYPGGISSYSREHVINSLMYQVGFAPIERSALPAGQGSVDVSVERLADYDADILLVYPFGQTAEQLRRAVPTLETLDSARKGRLFILEDLALSNSSVLSIPYALDTLLPEIARALV